MGAGCYYTNKYFDKDWKENSVRAVWLEIDNPDDNEFAYQDARDDLFESLKSVLNVSYFESSEYTITTPLYNISFEGTYNGDGLVIKQGVRFEGDYLTIEENRYRNMAVAGFERNYYGMINKLVSLGYSFRIATSSCTSGEYTK